MKKKFLSVTLICALMASMGLQSCIGSFGLSNKLLAWNKTIGSKFVNELVFFVFWIVPVYEVSGLADLIVLNSIEFWSGSSPVAKGKTYIDGKDGKYLVECDGKGYTITSMADNTTTRLNFHSDDKSWTLVGKSGKEYTLLQYIDDTRVLVPSVDGQMMSVDLTADGLYAYQETNFGR